MAVVTEHSPRWVPPSLDRLGETGATAVHETSMRLVEELGVQLDDERARELAVDAGGTVHGDDVVTLPRAAVERAVGRAPSQFTLHARNPDNDVTVGRVGGDDAGPDRPRAVRAPGYGPANVRTATGGRRRATLADYEDLVTLSQLEDGIDCTGYSVCDPADVPDASKHLEMLLRSLTLTDQPVMGATDGRERAASSLELVGIAMDDPELSKPCVAGLVNTVPPRRIDAGMLGGLLTYAAAGQPVVVSSFTMAGASGPPSLAASLAQANAETLVGITLAQLCNPGTPVVYGLPAATIDARHGSLSIGGPESALIASFAATMGRYYEVPSRGGGGLTDAKTVDYQAGFESTLIQSATALSGVDFVLNAAGVLGSYSTISPEKFVLDCEVLRYVDRIRDGVAIPDDGVALDQLASVEPGEQFFDHADPTGGEEVGAGGDGADAFYRSTVAEKRSHAAWADDGAPSAFERARDRVTALLDGYERPPMAADVERDLEAYVADYRAK